MTWNELQSEISRIESTSGNLSQHLSNLATAHRALITKEVKEQKSRLTIATACFAGGIALALCGLLIIAISVAEAFSEGTDMSRPTAYALVALLLLLAAGGAAVGGVLTIKKFSPVPHEGIQSFKETMACLIKRHL